MMQSSDDLQYILHRAIEICFFFIRYIEAHIYNCFTQLTAFFTCVVSDINMTLTPKEFILSVLIRDANVIAHDNNCSYQ